MSTSITSISPSKETIHPSLDIVVDIPYTESTNFPISIKGMIRGEDSLVLGTVYEIPNKTSSQIRFRASHYSERYSPNNIMLKKFFRLELDQKSLDHIENLRNKNPKGDVIIHFEISILNIEGKLQIGGYDVEEISIQTPQGAKKINVIKLNPQSPSYAQPHLHMMIQAQSEGYLNFNESAFTMNYTIHGSDWINDFQPQLGIGKFLVMEIPEIITTSEQKDEFTKRLHSATQRLKEIGDLLRKGEWDDVAEDCRGVYEDLRKKFDDEFESSVKELLKDVNGISDKGLSAFNDMIKNIGLYSHEFHHYRDEKGNVKQVSVHKEDAYALYISLVGLLNMLTVKHHRLSKLNNT